ncbi:unnamed protein product [Polarella glacialis]|uniref:Uncharacterized protein n=1 Tax=Polarella glacialis TaxID=89957 RepID=A0A813HB93_POLGL|nr:unnamed protein product [Polarella glacialis]CAE8709538.1 unnamed protein product [Polarella glacialis]
MGQLSAEWRAGHLRIAPSAGRLSLSLRPAAHLPGPGRGRGRGSPPSLAWARENSAEGWAPAATLLFGLQQLRPRRCPGGSSLGGRQRGERRRGHALTVSSPLAVSLCGSVSPLRPRFFPVRGCLGNAGAMPQGPLAGNDDEASRALQGARGLEFWRSGPPEEPADKFGDSEADFARGILDRRLPLRSLALLFLPPEVMPCVGQQVEVLIDSSSSKGALQLAILDYGTSFNGGLVACVPELEGASGNPWGGTAAEFLDLVRLDGPEALVRLRGVSSVRLVAHQPANEVTISVTTALLQEVPEYADGLLSLEAGQKLEADVQELEGLFAQCGEMQRRSGLTAAGDFVSKTLMQREADVLETYGPK